MGKYKILHVLSFCNERGTTPTVTNIVKNMPEYDHFFVFFAVSSEEAKQEFEKYGTVVVMEETSRLSFDYPQLPKFVQDNEIDLVHVYLPGDNLPTYITELSVPVVMTVNCTKGCHFDMEHLAKVIVPSEYSASLNPQLNPQVIPYGSDPLPPSLNFTDWRDFYGFDRDAVLISRVGSIETVKHIEDFYKVASYFRHLENVHWIIGGKDSAGMLKYLKSQADNPNIVELGYLSEQDKFDLYNASDFCLYPSEFEAFGFSLLEPLMCGIPVVSYNESAIPETVGPGGILAPFNNVEALAEATASLIARPLLREELGRLGYEHWQGRFKSQFYAAGIKGTYKELLNERL